MARLAEAIDLPTCFMNAISCMSPALPSSPYVEVAMPWGQPPAAAADHPGSCPRNPEGVNPPHAESDSIQKIHIHRGRGTAAAVLNESPDRWGGLPQSMRGGDEPLAAAVGSGVWGGG
jgi:hypothetical protein